MIEKRPRVGVGVMVVKDGMVLLGKRKNAHGDGTWNFPGGHLEFGESLEQCAAREVLEETGLEIGNIKPAALTNDVFENEKKHYITIIMQAEILHGSVENKEPHKCEEWKWFDLNDLPEPLFLPIKHMKEQNYSFAT